MDALTLSGYALIGIDVTILLVSSLFLVAFRHYVLKIAMSMPVMQWMTFKEVVAIGCPERMAYIVLAGLYKNEALEIRVKKSTKPSLSRNSSVT